ncbi:hypothetical protein [Paenibacillus sp. FSL R7-0337]|nr:hypothetical protein [Paenibacillus sp. FSL R7-0337]
MSGQMGSPAIRVRLVSSERTDKQLWRARVQQMELRTGKTGHGPTACPR